MSANCICPNIDGYRIRTKGACPRHGEDDARVHAEKKAERTAAERASADVEAACAWSDFRKDYGVSSDGNVRRAEHRAFMAGFKAGLGGDQSGPLR